MEKEERAHAQSRRPALRRGRPLEDLGARVDPGYLHGRRGPKPEVGQAEEEGGADPVADDEAAARDGRRARRRQGRH